MAAKNRLILGLMTIGPDTALGARITDLGEYKRCLDYLTSKGYNELDTAAMYVGGKQEAFTKDAGFKDRGFRIASKIMPTEPRDHAPEKLLPAWDVSLGKLGVESTDIVSGGPLSSGYQISDCSNRSIFSSTSMHPIARQATRRHWNV